MEIAAAFVTIRPETSGFEAELASAVGGQDVEIPVTADTGAAEDAVESIPDGEVEVTANTEQAEQSLDQVREKVEEASGATSQLGDAASNALQGMGGLGGAAGGAASSLGSSAVAGAAAATGLFAFAQGAIDAESAAQRFDLIAGSLGDSVRTIDVGGLTGDIGDLALQLGSSDEAMLNATATFVSFARSTGATDDQIVAASDNINALALRAVALNPALGDAGAVAEQMRNALARGGRATTQFGIGLTSAEINARALSDTGKENVADLTQFEKAAAGAELAVERLGTTMGSDFQAGSENARTEWNRMTESLGEASESVGGLMLPAIENITGAVTELGDGIANLDFRQIVRGFLDLGPGLIANGFTDLWNAIRPGTEELAGQGEVVEQSSTAWANLGTAQEDAAAQAEALTAAQEAAAQAVANTLPTLGDTISTVDRAGQAFGILNAASDPQAIIDNLSLALFAWDDFQNNITTIDDWGPRIAGALQQLGPEVAGGLTSALAEGNIATIVQLDGLIAQIEQRGGDAADVLTGFAQTGMDGAVAAVQNASGPMGAAGTAAGATGAAGIDAGLSYSNAAGIGQITGVQYGAAVGAGITSMTGTVSAIANNLIASAGSISAAYSRGQTIGSSYGAGLVAGLAGQIGNAVSTAAALRAAAQVESAGAGVGRTSTASTASTRITLVNQLDGRVLEERIFEVARTGAIAEGFEQ